MKNLMSVAEFKKWKRALYGILLLPLWLGLILGGYVTLLQVAGLCPKVDFWPPICPAMGINLAANVDIVITMLCYTYLFYAVFISVLFGIVIFARSRVLKWRARHNIEVMI